MDQDNKPPEGATINNVVRLPGLNREQVDFICEQTERAIEVCTRGDGRRHAFVIMMVTQEEIMADGNDRTTVASLSKFPRGTVVDILSDWLRLHAGGPKAAG